MEAATALAPALGIDAAALVGRSLHTQQRVAAAARVQAAWRETRAYRRRFVALWLSLSSEQRNREEQRLARVLGGRVLAMETDGIVMRYGYV